MKTLTRTLAICTLLVYSTGICNAQSGYVMLGKVLYEATKAATNPPKPVYQPQINKIPAAGSPITINQPAQQPFTKPIVTKVPSLINMNSKESGKLVAPYDIIKNTTQRKSKIKVQLPKKGNTNK